jgi:hypothetical protein
LNFDVAFLKEGSYNRISNEVSQLVREAGGRTQKEGTNMANIESIDLGALQADIAKLSPEEIREQLLALRTRQKVQQKKYHNTEAATAYRKKRAEFNKLLAAKAKQLGIYDKIKADADAKATEIIAGEQADTQDAVETEEEEVNVG